jgi:hypothetical protein
MYVPVPFSAPACSDKLSLAGKVSVFSLGLEVMMDINGCAAALHCLRVHNFSPHGRTTSLLSVRIANLFHVITMTD